MRGWVARGQVLLMVSCVLAVLAPAALADTVSAPITVSGATLEGVACTSATSCVAVGANAPPPAMSEGVVVPITDGSPGTAITVTGTNYLRGVTCPSATSCEAVGEGTSGGVVVPITDGIPGTPVSVPGAIALAGVTCQSATQCDAVGQSSAGNDGVVVPIIDGSPGAAIPVPGTFVLGGVACPTATSCEAVGNSDTNGTLQGRVVQITNGLPGTAIPVSGTVGVYGIACQNASSCEGAAIGTSNHAVVVPITNGVPGSLITIAGTGALYGVSCPTASGCVAVGSAVVPITNGAPGTPITVAGAATLQAVACSSATSCEAVGYSDVVSVSTLPGGNMSIKLIGHATSRGSRVADKVRCHGPAAQSCVITEQLSTVETLRNGKPVAVAARAKSKRKHLAVILATKTIAIQAGHTATIRIRLDGAGIRLLKRFSELPVTLTISLPQNAGLHTVAKRKLTLKPTKPKH